ELVAGDLRGERAAIDNLRKQVLEDLKRLDDKLDQVEEKEREAEHSADQPPRSHPTKPMPKAPGAQDKVDLGISDSETAIMLSNLTPEAAANILEQLALNNKLDKAAKLLADLPDRQAAQILALITDQNLAGQLVEKSKLYKRRRISGKE